MDSENWVEFPLRIKRLFANCYRVLSTNCTMLVETDALFGLNFSVKETFGSKLCSEEIVGIITWNLFVPYFSTQNKGHLGSRYSNVALESQWLEDFVFPVGALFTYLQNFFSRDADLWPPGWHEACSNGFGNTAIKLLLEGVSHPN